MRITYLPVLPTLRELYSRPRTMERFRAYIETLTGGTDDIVVPIGQANPMAKEHALAAIDRLLGLGADELGALAAADASERLQRVPGNVEIKATIVLTDDVGGGWTNRHTTEAMVRFPSRGALKRPFATALVWTSESPAAEQIQQEVLAAIYRVAYQQRRGLPNTLRQMLEQEGLAGTFAGQQPTLGQEHLEAVRTTMLRLDLDSAPYPEIFAALYGDDAATQLGYRALGLPPRAGFEYALVECKGDPVEALLQD
jgi:hypothetical protein